MSGKFINYQNNIFIYLKNSAWIVIEKGLRIFFGLFIGVWVARYLGPEEYGLLSFSQSFVFIFSSFSTLGITSVLTRDFLKKKYSDQTLLTTSIFLVSCGCFLMLFLMIITLSLFKYTQYQNVLILILASSTPFVCMSVIECYFQSRVQSKFSSISGLASMAITGVLRIYLIMTEAELLWFAIAASLEAILCFIGIYICFSKTSTIRIFKFSQYHKEVALSILKSSWPFIITGVMISLYMRVDQVMIKNYLGDRAVGEFTAAVRLSESWFFLPMALISSIYPALMNAKQNSIKLYQERLKIFFSHLIYIAFAISTVISFFSDDIVLIIFGEKYFAAGGVLCIYIWSGVFICIGLLSSQCLTTDNLQIYITINSTIALLINITLNFLFIEHFGLLGAAYSTLISQLFSSYLLLLFWERTRPTFMLITRSMLSFPRFNFL